MTPLKIASWNINSVRLRMGQVTQFLEEAAPDVLCLQETKCANGAFPVKAFETAGYPHLHLNGQGGQHGVAIASRLPLTPLDTPDHCSKGHPRVAVAEIAGVEVHCYYVPAGGDEPDPQTNEKFAHKLDFLERMTAYFARNKPRFDTAPVVITGDLNIAPSPHDVWSHKQLLTVVSHTPVETDGLNAAQAAGGFTDAVRAALPEPETIFSWWSYRARDWRKSNRGRRLDHIWVSQPLADSVRTAGREAVTVHTHTRDWEKPSDHVPITAIMTL